VAHAPTAAVNDEQEGRPQMTNVEGRVPEQATTAESAGVQRVTAKAPHPSAVEHFVRMRDGVLLATDVYLPTRGGGPGPTVLTRLPYDKSGDYCFMPLVARYFTDRGFRVVVQDVRGKFRSEGETLNFVNETYDGYDTLSWVASQPWSDGQVGMWGDSYYGYTQWAAAASAHPALKAMVPRLTGTDVGALPRREPGAASCDVEMSVSRLYALSWFHDNDFLMWDLDMSVRPLAAEAERFFDLVGARSASYDLDFPYASTVRRFPSGSPFDAPAIPVLMTIGWWDNCALWQWADHRRIDRDPRWRAGEYLLLEAIDHENHSHFELPDLKSATESEAVLRRMLQPAVDFFDVFLRGAPNTIPRVRWQLANSGDPAFRDSPCWPPPGTRQDFLYLHVDGAEFGSLDAAPGTEQSVSWRHDPNDLVPSPVNDSFAYLSEYPDESSRMRRSDVLAFVGEELQEHLDLVGPVSLSCHVSSQSPEFDVFIRLLDVSADGSAHLVARGQQTVVPQSAITHLNVDMGHVGYRLRAGHRLAVTINGSDFPDYVPAPGTGQHRWLATDYSATTQHLKLGADDGARLEITVLDEAG
jgi:uncharacterized protein